MAVLKQLKLYFQILINNEFSHMGMFKIVIFKFLVNVLFHKVYICIQIIRSEFKKKKKLTTLWVNKIEIENYHNLPFGWCEYVGRNPI